MLCYVSHVYVYLSCPDLYHYLALLLTLEHLSISLSLQPIVAFLSDSFYAGDHRL